MLALPDFVYVLDGVEIYSQEARAKLTAKLDLLMKQITGYRTRATTALLEVYNLLAKTILHVDNLQHFYFLLSGHINAAVLDDIRNKMAGGMIAPSIRKHVTGELMSRQEAEDFRKNASGIFGGILIIA